MIIHEMWQAEMPYLTPLGFRVRFPSKSCHSLPSNTIPEINLLPCATILRIGSARRSGVPELSTGWSARGLEQGFAEATSSDHA